jgi:preprotein translocase subunit SecE
MKNPFLAVRGYMTEVVDELKRCNWPTGLELRDSTIVVIIAVLILGAAIAIVDFASTWAVRHLTTWGLPK